MSLNVHSVLELSAHQLPEPCLVCRGLDPQRFGSDSPAELIHIKDLFTADDCWGYELLLRVIDSTRIRRHKKDKTRWEQTDLNWALPTLKLEKLWLKIRGDGHVGLYVDIKSFLDTPQDVLWKFLVYAEGLSWNCFCAGKSASAEVHWPFWMDVSIFWRKKR